MKIKNTLNESSRINDHVKVYFLAAATATALCLIRFVVVVVLLLLVLGEDDYSKHKSIC